MRTKLFIPGLVLASVLWGSGIARAGDSAALAAWFAKPEADRGPVPVTRGDKLKKAAAVKPAAEKIWQAYKTAMVSLGWETNLPPVPLSLEAIQALPENERPQFARGALTDSGKEMPFYLIAKGKRGANGWPFFISLHGGGMDGNADGPHGSRMNDREWQAQVRLLQSIYPDGLYFIPRMADDHDGRWWYSYCQAIFDRAIRSAILFRNVDPNRVYIMGISEGGYAGYRLGAHMADRWAGSCAMAAAEPLSTSPPENFRNLPFRCGIGERDTMFDRINLARAYFDRLAALRAGDGATNAYVTFLDEQKGRGHGIDYKPGPLWIAGFVRNPWPDRVVWTVQPLHGVVRRQMYWLALDTIPEKTPLYLAASVDKNVIYFSAEQDSASKERVPATGVSLRVYLNDTLANLDKPVKLVVNGKQVFDGKVDRKQSALARSLSERGDPCLMFPVEIPLRL